MPKIKKKNKIEQCTKIFIYRDLKDWLNFNVLLLFAVSFNNVTNDWSCFSFSFSFVNANR